MLLDLLNAQTLQVADLIESELGGSYHYCQANL